MLFVPVRKSFAFYLFIFSFIVFTSCSKSESNGPDSAEVCRLDSMVNHSIRPDGLDYKTAGVYSWDQNNRLTEIRLFSYNEFVSRIQVIYTDDGKIESVTGYSKDGNKIEERLVIYDQQKRVGGFHYKVFAPYSNAIDKYSFVYEENKITSIGWAKGDTASKRVRFFENGNEIRFEYWENKRMLFVDSVTFSTFPATHIYEPDLSLVTNSFYSSKNLPARRKNFDMINKVYQEDASFTYEFNSTGQVKKIFNKSNLEGASPTPLISERFYSCSGR